MQQAPFDEKYQGVLIRVNSMAITDTFWTMDAKETITGTPLSKLWLHHAERTNLLGDGSITANITLILRNQNDYSNVIILLGTYSVMSEHNEKTYERMILLLSEFLFEKAKEYVVETNLKGVDNKEFLIPNCYYTDDFFKQELDWSFR